MSLQYLKAERFVQRIQEELKRPKPRIKDSDDDIEWDEETKLTRKVETRPWNVQPSEIHELNCYFGYEHAIRRNLYCRDSLSNIHGFHDIPAIQPPPVKRNRFDPTFIREEESLVKKIRAREAAVQLKKQLEDKTIRVEKLPEHLQNLPKLPNGGPNKVDLNRRRSVQYGKLLNTMGIWKTMDASKSDRMENGFLDKRTRAMKNPWCNRVPNYDIVSPLTVARIHPCRAYDEMNQWNKITRLPTVSRLAVLEYLDETPIFRCLTGMRSSIIQMKRMEEGGEEDEEDEDEEDSYGVKLSLSEEEPSPLLMDPAPEDPPVTFIYNPAMNLPVFEQPAQGMDFILFPLSGEIAPVALTFLSGQVEPRTTPTPPRDYIHGETQIMLKYIEASFLMELYISPTLTVMVEPFLRRFDYVQPDLIRTLARRHCQLKETRWVVSGAKPLTELREQIKNKLELNHWISTLTPTQWDSTRRGMRSIRKAGLNLLVDAEVRDVLSAYQHHVQCTRVLYQVAKKAHVEYEATLREHKKTIHVMKYIARELMKTPRHQAYCFDKLFLNIEAVFNPFPSGTVMQGNTESQDLMSYLPNYEAAVFEKKYDSNGELIPVPKAGEGEEEDEFYQDVYESEFRPPPLTRKKMNMKYTAHTLVKYGGTDDDLRIVSMDRLRDILIALGIPAEQVQGIKRWDRTWLIEQVASSKLGKNFLNGSIEKYSRVNNIKDKGVSEDVQLRWKIEESIEFTAMRQRCTEIYHRLKMFALKENKSSGSRSSSRKGQKDAIMEQIEHAEKEAKDMEDFMNHLKFKMIQDSKQKLNQAERDKRRPIEDWAKNQPSPGPSQMIIETRIQKLRDGKERIIVKFILDPDQVSDLKRERKSLKRQYKSRAETFFNEHLKEKEYEEVEIVDEGYL